MDTQPLTPDTLRRSVIAVPPLARHADLTLNIEANRQIVRRIEAGGVTTLLYGGNANLYHVRPSEYESLLQMLCDLVGPDTLVIPSVGPAYGVMMDQAELLKDFAFPTAMMLPQQDLATPDGVARGVRSFAETWGRPVVLYIKHDGYMDVSNVRRLMNDGLLSAIKYAIVRDDPGEDRYLRELVAAAGPDLTVSGMGEQPAIVHMRDFELPGFTSGCVCIAPALSTKMLQAIQAGDFAAAESVRQLFRPLEDLRNRIHPVRVLHEATALACIADTGPLLPLLSPISDADRDQVQEAVAQLKRTANGV
jgi:dihydrodipicolinate synthase/N-acetylneuraminate lyase